jgi:hypothetical protein
MKKKILLFVVPVIGICEPNDVSGNLTDTYGGCGGKETKWRYLHTYVITTFATPATAATNGPLLLVARRILFTEVETRRKRLVNIPLIESCYQKVWIADTPSILRQLREASFSPGKTPNTMANAVLLPGVKGG